MDIRDTSNRLIGIRQAGDNGPRIETLPPSQPINVQSVIAVQPAEPTIRANAVKKVDDTAMISRTPGQNKMNQLRDAVDMLSRSIHPATQPNSLQFAIEEDLGEVVVKVIDRETKEVIKQFPTEEAIALAKSLDKTDGFLHQTKA